MLVEEDQLDALRKWVCETDEHADRRLEVLSRALLWLEQPPDARQVAGREIAEQLDRWRYQCLGRRAGQQSAADREFLRFLDTLASQLVQRPSSMARQVREAVVDGFATEPRLEPPRDTTELAQRAQQLTRQRFSSRAASRSVGSGLDTTTVTRSRDVYSAGRRMVLYAPLYLSNFCTNYCTYCGFRYPQDTPRVHLSADEAWQQARILMERGFRHLLLVAGDFPRLTSPDYLVDIIRPLRNEGLTIGVEIAAQSVSGYSDLVEAGASSVTLYQETYSEQLYPQFHPRGSKSAFDWRLECSTAPLKRVWGVWDWGSCWG